MKKNILIILFCFVSSVAGSEMSNEDMKKKMIHTLKDVKEYKFRKNKQIKKLQSEVDRLNKELLVLKRKLLSSNKELTQIQEQFNAKELVVEVDGLESDTDMITTTVKEINEQMKKPTEEVVEDDPAQLSWIEVIVEDSMDIYQLAVKYYNNRESYKGIYAMNQNIIDDSLIIKNGMSLKIPIVEDFEEKPVILNKN